MLSRQYFKSLKGKSQLLKNNKNQYYKLLKFKKTNNNYVISHIIKISFSSINTTFNISKFSGKPDYFLTAGNLFLKGKQKRFRPTVLRFIKDLLIKKCKLSRLNSLALHLKNVRFLKYWVIKDLKKKLFLQVVKNFTSYPFNGCWKKKLRRKKRDGWVVKSDRL